MNDECLSFVHRIACPFCSLSLGSTEQKRFLHLCLFINHYNYNRSTIILNFVYAHTEIYFPPTTSSKPFENMSNQLGLGIALIVILGVIPALVLIWVCIWLLFFYAGDRTCWCTKRKRKTPSPDYLEKTASYDANQPDSNYNSSYNIPSGPYTARSTVEAQHSDPTILTPPALRADARGSKGSMNSLQVSQEPKPFV